MNTGFFPVSAFSSGPEPRIPRCGACGLYKDCMSPRMPPTGEGRRGVLIVAESPGETEDVEGTQLIGRSGKLLRRVLGGIGIDLDRDCVKTNALICKGESNDKRIECCRPNLYKTIRDVRPDVVVLLGGVAVKSLIGHEWKSDVGKVSRWVGWRIPCQKLNAWIYPMYHPAYLLREGNPVLDLWFKRHLKEAFALRGKPWPDGPPDYAGEVRRLYKPDEVAGALSEFMAPDNRVAFDYETNMLKPDSEDARIVSCAVSDGRTTIAYPWAGEAIRATGELLRSKVGKIAANLKFEERWTRAEFGHGVRNWEWDTMVAAHVLDNRPGITSLDFQAFAQLGQAPWGEAVKAFFKSDGSNAPNRIDQVPIVDLLLYNSLDALTTYKIAEIQRKEMGLL